MYNDDDAIVWLQHELKIRDFFDRKYQEQERLGTEYAKIIITNLIWINAAGLGSLPITSTFIGINALPWELKRDMLFSPGCCFIGGLFAALFCSFIAYLSFGAGGAGADAACNAEMNTFRTFYKSYKDNDNLKALIDEWRNNGEAIARKAEKFAVISSLASIALGIASFILFVFATYMLVKIVPP